MRVNEIYQENSFRDFKCNLEYEEWLRDFIKPLSEDDINQMEDEKLKSVNSLDYQPFLEGA